MPNQERRNKTNGSRRARGRTTAPQRTDSVKELLARSLGAFAPIARQATRQSGWREWLEARLPAPLAAHVTGVVERDDALVVFAESASWSVRLRYALAELEPELRREHPGIARLTVRVMPQRGAGSSDR